MRRESAERRKKRGLRKLAIDVALLRDKTCVGIDLIPDHICAGPLDAHEPLSRARGGDPYDPAQIVVICRRGHDFVHNHPLRASELGLLRSSGTRYVEGRLVRREPEPRPYLAYHYTYDEDGKQTRHIDVDDYGLAGRLDPPLA